MTEYKVAMTLLLDDIDHGILGQRQRTWADGFPNDPYTENPVVYKYVRLFDISIWPVLVLY